MPDGRRSPIRTAGWQPDRARPGKAPGCGERQPGTTRSGRDAASGVGDGRRRPLPPGSASRIGAAAVVCLLSSSCCCGPAVGGRMSAVARRPSAVGRRPPPSRVSAEGVGSRVSATPGGNSRWQAEVASAGRRAGREADPHPAPAWICRARNSAGRPRRPPARARGRLQGQAGPRGGRPPVSKRRIPRRERFGCSAATSDRYPASAT